MGMGGALNVQETSDRGDVQARYILAILGLIQDDYAAATTYRPTIARPLRARSADLGLADRLGHRQYPQDHEHRLLAGRRTEEMVSARVNELAAVERSPGQPGLLNTRQAERNQFNFDILSFAGAIPCSFSLHPHRDQDPVSGGGSGLSQNGKGGTGNGALHARHRMGTLDVITDLAILDRDVRHLV